MNLPAISVTSTARGRFLMRLALWLACYSAIMLAWGERNSWPLEIVAPLCSLPVAFVIGSRFYRIHQISLETREAESQWTLLICFLLLAIGFASGLMLLMSVGWVCLGVAWLRPAQPQVQWDEWFKLPLLFVLAMPVISDLAGSRHEWLNQTGMDLDGTQAVEHFLFTQLALRIVLFTVVVRFSGPTFWVGLVLFPFAFLGGRIFGQVFTEVYHAWLMIAAAAAILAGIWWSLRKAPVISHHTWRDFTIRILSRPQSPWLAGLVITLQQSALLERWLSGAQPKLEVIGVLVLLIVLLRLRWRSPATSLHVFSQILLAGALFVLLAAEWTDLNILRQISLGMLVVSAFSWHRAWSLWILALAMACWIAALPAPAVVLLKLGFPAEIAGQFRNFLMALGLAALALLSFLNPYTRSRTQYSDFGWMPVKRFAVILLLLLAGFQTASVYLPQAGTPAAPPGHTGFMPMVTSRNELLFFHALAADKQTRRLKDHTVDLFFATPLNEPVHLQSPELVLKKSGWTILSRRLLPHTYGQVAELQLERNSRRATALCWYQFGDQTFTHYLRARNILWSGWNFNHRDLRMVMMLTDDGARGQGLAELAEAENWFLRTGPAKPRQPS